MDCISKKKENKSRNTGKLVTAFGAQNSRAVLFCS